MKAGTDIIVVFKPSEIDALLRTLDELSVIRVRAMAGKAKLENSLQRHRKGKV